jgi:hypothetical protein
MTKCEFCPKFFIPRLQTKKARACEDRECQDKRQSLNEKEWRNRNKGDYGAKYYAKYRMGRLRYFAALVERILKALRAGCTLLGESFSIEDFKEVLIPFLLRLGIRRANKLCSPGEA